MKLSLNIGALKKVEEEKPNASPLVEDSNDDSDMDTSEDQQVVAEEKPVASVQIGGIRSGFSLNLNGIGSNTQQAPPSEKLQVEEEDEFDNSDVKESPSTILPSTSIPKFNLKLPTSALPPSSPNQEVTPSPSESSSQHTPRSIAVDLLIPNLCTLYLDATSSADLKSQIETELNNTLKREELELFILTPVNSLDDVKNTDRIVCKTTKSNGK